MLHQLLLLSPNNDNNDAHEASRLSWNESINSLFNDHNDSCLKSVLEFCFSIRSSHQYVRKIAATAMTIMIRELESKNTTNDNNDNAKQSLRIDHIMKAIDMFDGKITVQNNNKNHDNIKNNNDSTNKSNGVLSSYQCATASTSSVSTMIAEIMSLSVLQLSLLISLSRLEVQKQIQNGVSFEMIVEEYKKTLPIQQTGNKVHSLPIIIILLIYKQYCQLCCSLLKMTNQMLSNVTVYY